MYSIFWNHPLGYSRTPAIARGMGLNNEKIGGE